MAIKKGRIHELNQNPIQEGPIIYWMSRDQRTEDNWALLYAQELAIGRDLIVVFNLVPEFSEATLRQYDFMLKGLQEVDCKLREKNIPFYILQGDPKINIPDFIKTKKAGALITGFDPLKIKKKWIQAVIKKIDIKFLEVDAHNIVPCRKASQKQEYAARTIRPKINSLLPEYLEEFPEVKKRPQNDCPEINWESLYDNLKINKKVKPVDWLKPGESSARKHLKHFLENQIKQYTEKSNDPNAGILSNMSPYIHFGQISAQRVALEVQKADIPEKAKASYLEQLVIRRELTDNYCLYNEHYDSLKSISKWAKETLEKHKDDQRRYIYSIEAFEHAQTHDPLWNAAQKEMLLKGKMHGYMRMYWAKKILEWTEWPEIAFDIALYLNDKYELDGRDPNGYVGIAWAIGGVHDHGWKEIEVYGKIRYMNYNGCKRKFDVAKYITEQNKNNHGKTS